MQQNMKEMYHVHLNPRWAARTNKLILKGHVQVKNTVLPFSYQEPVSDGRAGNQLCHVSILIAELVKL